MPLTRTQRWLGACLVHVHVPRRPVGTAAGGAFARVRVIHVIALDHRHGEDDCPFARRAAEAGILDLLFHRLPGGILAFDPAAVAVVAPAGEDAENTSRSRRERGWSRTRSRTRTRRRSRRGAGSRCTSMAFAVEARLAAMTLHPRAAALAKGLLLCARVRTVGRNIRTRCDV